MSLNRSLLGQNKQQFQPSENKTPIQEKPRTKLPSVEGTPLASNAQFSKATFDRYTYIQKADFQNSGREVALKKSDKVKSDLLNFMHELNKVGSAEGQSTIFDTSHMGVSKRNDATSQHFDAAYTE